MKDNIFYILILAICLLWNQIFTMKLADNLKNIYFRIDAQQMALLMVYTNGMSDEKRMKFVRFYAAMRADMLHNFRKDKEDGN